MGGVSDDLAHLIQSVLGRQNFLRIGLKRPFSIFNALFRPRCDRPTALVLNASHHIYGAVISEILVWSNNDRDHTRKCPLPRRSALDWVELIYISINPLSLSCT